MQNFVIKYGTRGKSVGMEGYMHVRGLVALGTICYLALDFALEVLCARFAFSAPFLPILAYSLLHCRNFLQMCVCVCEYMPGISTEGKG